MPRVASPQLDLLYLHPFPFGTAQARGLAPPDLPLFPVMPVGVAGLCSGLSAAGHRVAGLNLPVARMMDPGFTVERWLAERPPVELVLMDLHWHEHSLGAVELASAVRELWPDAWIVLGGLTASAFATELLALCPAVDGVIHGDAELPLLRLCEGLASGGAWPPAGVPNLVSRGRAAPPRWVASPGDLDAVDAVDLGFLAHAEAYRRLLHSHPRRPGREPQVGARGHWLPNGRGCAWDCASCGGSRSAHRALAGRRGVTWRSPMGVVRDLSRLRELGVEQVALGLDPDLAGAGHRDTCLAGARGLGLYLESFQLPSTALLDGVAEHCELDHSEIAISALSGDPALRRRHGKDFDDSALLASVDDLIARGISGAVFFSIGLPGEDEAAFEASLGLARRIGDRDRQGLLRVMALPQALDPLAPMAVSPASWGFEPTDAGDLAARLARGRALAEGRIQPLDPEALGYRVPGCDPRARTARWNALATEAPGVIIPSLGV
jgi:hypothetical protein